MSAVPWREIRTLFLDAGNTIVSIDFPWVASVLAERGVAVDAARSSARRPRRARASTPGSAGGSRPRPTRRSTSISRTCSSGSRPSRARRRPCARARAASSRPCCAPSATRTGSGSASCRAFRRRSRASGELGLQLVVVSNSDGSVERSITSVGLRPFFDAVMDSHVVGAREARPRFFEAALAASGADPKRHRARRRPRLRRRQRRARRGHPPGAPRSPRRLAAAGLRARARPRRDRRAYRRSALSAARVHSRDAAGLALVEQRQGQRVGAARAAREPARRCGRSCRTVNRAFDRVAMHAVRASSSRAQAAARRAPAPRRRDAVPVQQRRLRGARCGARVAAAQADGVGRMAFGDLFLADVRALPRAAARRQRARRGLPALGRATRARSRARCSRAGSEPCVTCVDPQQVPAALAGRALRRGAPRRRSPPAPIRAASAASSTPSRGTARCSRADPRRGRRARRARRLRLRRRRLPRRPPRSASSTAPATSPRSRALRRAPGRLAPHGSGGAPRRRGRRRLPSAPLLALRGFGGRIFVAEAGRPRHGLRRRPRALAAGGARRALSPRSPTSPTSSCCPRRASAGLGRALLARAEAFARAEGAAVLRIDVMAENAGARSLYARFGFRERTIELEKRSAIPMKNRRSASRSRRIGARRSRWKRRALMG